MKDISVEGFTVITIYTAGSLADMRQLYFQSYLQDTWQFLTVNLANVYAKIERNLSSNVIFC